MRSLVALAVRRRVTVLMAALAVAAFGLVGYNRLALELMPDVTYPSLTVQTEFADAAPLEVENLITRPIEETVGVLRGLQNVHSVSRAGISEVTLEFGWDSDMDMLSMDVREKLDRLVLPEEAEDPVVLRFDPSLDPIMRLALSAQGVDLAEIRRIAEKKVKQEFETIKGVAAAQIKGGLEEEIRVDVDQERLASLGIPLERVRQVVEVSNINLPGGTLRDQDSQYLIRTVNEYGSIEEIADLVVWRTDNALVRLRDVADVRRGTKQREEITRMNGVECVEIAVYKEGDANTVTVARAVRARMTDQQESLPPDYAMTVLFDQSHFIEQAVGEVRNAAILGGILAIIVLFAFLRDVRSTIIITTSIPLSIVATFVAMYRLDISLNIMSLGGLTLGIGMLVDNSIVVLESIFRKRRQGLGLAAAAVEGTAEVNAAVVASTLTTVAVFLPIVFVEGIAGQLFKDQALTVTCSLLASLVVAMTLIPMLSAAGGRRRVAAASGTDADVMTLGAFSRGYDQFLRTALRRRALTLLVAFGLFFLALAGVRLVGTELIPPVSEGEFYFEVNMPEGTPLAATDRVVAVMEERVANEGGIEHYYSSVGSRLITGGMSLQTKAEHLGQVNVVMRDRADEAGETAAAEHLRRSFEGIPDLVAKHGKPTYFSLKTPVEVVLFGEDIETLKSYSLDLAQRLAAIRGLVDVRSSLEAGTPELQVIFNRARLAALGLDMRVLSETLHDRVQGVVPTRFKEEDRQIDIRVRNSGIDEASINDIRNLVLPGPMGRPIRLLSVADVHLDRGPAEIHRLQQQRAAVVAANLEGRSLGAVVGEIERVLQEEPPPSGVGAELGGQNREMQISFASLRFALALAVFLVYLVMAATFESLLHPFIVLFTIPLALVGVVAGLLVTQTSISVIVLIGAIMLVGIVVNNAIVLIDNVNQRRRAGHAKQEAVILAAHTRLRPILMTTLTTVLGLLPMALAWGEGAELRTPLGITVSSGLFLSTLLTLIVIPAAYMVVPSRVRAAEEEAEEEETGPAGPVAHDMPSTSGPTPDGAAS